MSSYSSTNQEDKSIQAADAVQTLLGADSNYSSTMLSNSMLISGDMAGDIEFNQFPQQVQQTIEELVGVTKSAITQSSESQMQATSAIANKLSDLSLGESSIIPKLALYGLIAVVVIVVGKRFL